MTPTAEQWAAAVEHTHYKEATYQVGISLFNGSHDALLDAFIDGEIPEPYRMQLWAAIDHNAIFMRRLERLMNRFEAAVERLVQR